MTLHRTLAAALAAAAIAAPAAAAKPAAEKDMHASTAQAAKAQQKLDQRQDLRSADTIDAAMHPRKSPVVVDAPGATVVDSQSKSPLPGPPTWPTNPKPITPAPAAKPVDDGGIDWKSVGIGLAGTVLAIGGIVAVTSRTRRNPRARVSV